MRHLHSTATNINVSDSGTRTTTSTATVYSCCSYILKISSFLILLLAHDRYNLDTLINITFCLCFVDRATRYNCVKKNQLDAQFILITFRQPLRVSGVSRPIIRRYNRMYTTIGTYYSI